MANNKLGLIPLHLWEQGTLHFPQLNTEPGDHGVHFFKRKQPMDPSYIGKKVKAFKKTSKESNPPTQN